MTELVTETEIEPWRQRLIDAFAARPDIEVTKFGPKIGKNSQYVKRLKTGDANPAPGLLIKICDELGVSVSYIMEGKDTGALKEDLVRRVINADEATLERLEQVWPLVSPGASEE